MIRKIAFTLAETLVTLIIIGVIAAMTIPILMQNTNDKQFKSALKKNYQVFSNAFNLQYGNYFYDDYRDWAFEHNNIFTEEVFKKLSNYVNVNTVCGRKYTDNKCFAPVKAKNGKPAHFFTENGFATNFAHLYTFTLIDGTSVAIDIWLKNSIKTYAGVYKNLIISDDNLVLLVDVNGVKKPNTLGKDVHMFVLTDYGLVPAGNDNGSVNCKNKNVTYNYDCTAKMLLEF